MRCPSLTSRAFERRLGGVGLRRGLRGGARLNKWAGVTVASTADYYATANPGGLAGSGTVWVCAVVVIASQAVASSTKRIAWRSNASNAGWQLYTTTTNANLNFHVYAGDGSAKASPTYNIAAGVVGTVLVVHGVHDGSFVRLYVNGVEAGSGTAITGYTAHSGATLLGNTSVAPVGMALMGLMGGTTVPSAAEVLASAAAIRSSKDLVAIAGKTDHLWSVKRDQTGSAPATLTNRAGAGNMTKNGSPTLVRFS